jgi:hypothetical protein
MFRRRSRGLMKWASVFAAWRWVCQSDESGWQDDHGRHRGGSAVRKDLLIVRTLAGQARAKAEGRRFTFHPPGVNRFGNPFQVMVTQIGQLKRAANQSTGALGLLFGASRICYSEGRK